jgi:hypothetical protein
MWRIYSSDRMGLCIRTTRSRLTQVFEAARAATPFDFCIGDVEYLPDAKAVDRADSLVHQAEAAAQTANGVIASLFIKRAAFDHEAEVRAVVHLLGESQYVRHGCTLWLPIDPHQLVDRIEFDPRVDPTFARMCTHYLKTVANFEGHIGRSTLYDESEWIIVV